jgi:hypothetical protein
MNLNGKHRKTLAAIYCKPFRSDVKWADIERLFVPLGAEVTEGSGSRVRVALKDRLAVFHRPHPQPTTDKGALRSVQRYLSEAGIRPEE